MAVLINPSEFKKIQEDIKSAPIRCSALNGTYIASNFGQCYTYDTQGFKFYWKLDENGRYYKVR